MEKVNEEYKTIDIEFLSIDFNDILNGNAIDGWCILKIFDPVPYWNSSPHKTFVRVIYKRRLNNEN